MREGEDLMKSWQWFVAVLLILLAAPVNAYLDPGTGSMLLQVILGGIAAIGVAIKLFWHKIRVAIGLSKKTGAGDEVS
jgi:hypothetical protein